MVQIHSTPHLAEEERPQPVRALLRVRAIGRATPERLDIRGLKQPPVGTALAGSPSASSSSTAHLQIVLEPIEAFSKFEDRFRQQPGAGPAQDILLTATVDLQAIRNGESGSKKAWIRMMGVESHTCCGTEPLDGRLVG